MYKITPGLWVLITALVLSVLASVFFSWVLRADEPRWPLLVPLFICVLPLLFAGKRAGLLLCVVSAIGLLVFVIIAAASVGLFYVPSAGLLIIAALFIKVGKFKDGS